MEKNYVKIHVAIFRDPREILAKVWGLMVKELPSKKGRYVSLDHFSSKFLTVIEKWIMFKPN